MITASDFFKAKFHTKVYKLSLDAGCTCPTRDGTLGSKGCIFCSASGSGDFASDRNLSIHDQIIKAKEKVLSKVKDGKYIAYFQNFTSTYGDPARLESLYFQAAREPDVVGVAIGTRPDCLGNEILEVINKLSQTTFVMVELGFQTSNEESALYIRRGYENSVYLNAVKLLKQKLPLVHVVTHVIFGLPGETESTMLDTVRYVMNAGSDGIKISVLHVLEGTDLAKDYKNGKVIPLEEDQYFDVLEKALSLIGESMVLHRLTGDGPKKILVAPLWTANKKEVLTRLNKLTGKTLPGKNY